MDSTYLQFGSFRWNRGSVYQAKFIISTYADMQIKLSLPISSNPL